MRSPIWLLLLAGTGLVVIQSVYADSPFAVAVEQFAPAPGQFVNDTYYDDPLKALGRPWGGGFSEPNNSSLVSLGGFGGSIVLSFDHTVLDDPANPFGIDAIVFGNGFWVSDNPNRKWAECGVIEISRDANSNSLADDPWYLISGSHIDDLAGQYETATWDDDIYDSTYPPADMAWIPPGFSGVWQTEGYLLPAAVFNVQILENPKGLDSSEEGIWGYADLSPTETMPDGLDPSVFYTRPDNPFEVGLNDGSGGGDGFDIAWAINTTTGEPAELDGFDFIRITTGVDHLVGIFGEISTEIDAVSDIAEGNLGDADGDGDWDLYDYDILEQCYGGPGAIVPTSPCRVMDYDQDGDVDLYDFFRFQQDLS